MKILNIFSNKKDKISENNHSILSQLVHLVKNGSVEKAVILLETKKKSNNPVAIPYTSKAINADFLAVRKCFAAEHLSDDELAALIAVIMMKKHPKGISELLSDNGYVSPHLERVIYLSTYVSTLQSLSEFSSIGVKKYKVSSCGDSRVCSKCAKHNGKKYSIDKAVIGKTAPPFCDNCRCLITAEF